MKKKKKIILLKIKKTKRKSKTYTLCINPLLPESLEKM